MRNYKLILGISLFFALDCGPNEPKPPQCPSMPESFGIYSETIYGVRLDIDSKIGTSYGGGGGFFPNPDSGFVDDKVEKVEGTKSKRSTISVASTGQWAVWFVQQGQLLSEETKNMCDYEGGNLKFWIKAEPDINDLIAGIRSGNVGAGEETSKVRLRNYPAFAADNQWHEVTIPLEHFEGDAPKADLTNIKVFFTIGSSSDDTGGTKGVSTFWIDNVRWTKK